MTHEELAVQLRDEKRRIILAYAFNATGKTRLCVAYKDATKTEGDEHTGVYYNAFSEDLFVWENDEDNDGADIRLMVTSSSLSKFHSLLSEDSVREKLKPYRRTYDFDFEPHADAEKGIKSIKFFIPDAKDDQWIKISRGEERIFVWCFFLALFEVDGWADKQASHFFIDDPVSSLDDHNIFVTASTIYDLIERHHAHRKIVITTHHIGLFAILSDWLTKGGEAEKFKKITKVCILSNKAGELTLEDCRSDVILYHLRALQILERAKQDDDLRAYHFALLRQVLENVASFLGVGQFGHVLKEIGIENDDEVASIVNTLSHKKVYYFESDMLVPDNKAILTNVLDRLIAKYKFVLHLK